MWIVADSFDYYGSTADVARSVWDSVTSLPTFTTGANTRFGTGQGITNLSGVSLQKNLSSNEATIFLTLAYYRPGALSGTTPEVYVILRDGATAQCTIVLESSGNIVLKSGIQTGTVLATYTGAFAQDVWTHFQIRVVISNTAGSLTVRKNGQTSDSFASPTNLNTRGGTANNYANVIVVTGGANAPRVDDLLVYSGSAPAPNDWVGDVRGVCQLAAFDTAQKDFATSLAGIVTSPTSGGAGNITMPANTILPIQMALPARASVVTKVTIILQSALTGQIQAAIYANDGPTARSTAGPWGNANDPGTRLGTSAIITNPGAGVLDLPFTPGVYLLPTSQVWVCLLASASFSTTTSAWIYGLNDHLALAQPFASGFPASCPASTETGGNTAGCTHTMGMNAAAVAEPLANGDTDFVYSSVVNAEDLYTVSPLAVTPFAVLAVVSKVYMRKSDAGTRQAQVRVKSASTEVAGTDTAISSTYTYVSRVDAVDPATGVAWTLAGVNAMQVGQRVTL
jgi:hypothetical protein